MLYTLRCLALATLALILLPCLAQAHAILTDSTPRPGASVNAGPLDLRFRYNSRIDRARSRLTLTHPDHRQTILPVPADGPPDTLGGHLDLTPGRYVVHWQVLAVDGHITRGEVPFTVTEP